MGVDESGEPLVGAFEHMLADFDDELCRRACADIGATVGESDSVLTAMKGLKGNGGAAFASRLIEDYPSISDWPEPLQTLVSRLDAEL